MLLKALLQGVRESTAQPCAPLTAATQLQGYRRPGMETVKGVNATEQKNYEENKGSYSCFKTFSQLRLRAFNQLFFFFLYCRFFFLPNICRGKKKLKKREKNTFRCQSVACKAMKSI